MEGEGAVEPRSTHVQDGGGEETQVSSYLLLVCGAGTTTKAVSAGPGEGIWFSPASGWSSMGQASVTCPTRFALLGRRQLLLQDAGGGCSGLALEAALTGRTTLRRQGRGL